MAGQNNSLAKVAVIIVGLCAAILIVFFFIVDLFIPNYNFKFKNRADIVNVELSLVSDNPSPKSGQEFTLKINAKPPQAITVQGYVLGLIFDKNKVELETVEYKSGKAIANLSDTTQSVGDSNSKGYVKLYAESDTDAGIIFNQNETKAIVEAKFKSKSDSSFEMKIGTVIPAGFYQIQTSGEMVKTNISGSNLTLNQGSGSQLGGLKLNLKLRFQGILKKPREDLNKITVKVTLVSSAGQKYTQSGDFTSDDNGLWSGSVNFEAPKGDGYKIFIKGPKHIQRKICSTNPTESQPAAYHCGPTDSLSIKSDSTDMDLSGILLLGGDLPIQDGIVDSYDLSVVRSNLSKKDIGVLNQADENLDGIVDTQDYSLILQALSLRYDEEN